MMPESVEEESVEESFEEEQYEEPEAEESFEAMAEGEVEPAAVEETVEPDEAEQAVEPASVEEVDDTTGEIFAEDAAVDQSWEEMQAQPEPAAEEIPVVEPEVVPVPESADAVEEPAAETDEEQIYDLFDLGAVEYVEETEVNL
jgi:hypothetical protein